jgi:hypothetical protein
MPVCECHDLADAVDHLIRRVCPRLPATWAHAAWPAKMSLVGWCRLPCFRGVIWPESGLGPAHGSGGTSPVLIPSNV